MTTTTNLAQFGLPNAITWAPTAAPLAGRSRLVYNDTNQPVGMLLKKVDSLEQALDAGGLFIRKVGTGRWMFLLRDTLRAVLAAGKLGAYVTDVSNQFTFTVDRRLLNVVKFETLRNPSVEYWTQSRNGFYVVGTTAYTPYFAPEDSLEVFGVVTGATRGMGLSHFVSASNSGGPVVMANRDAYGFSATDTAMSTTLTTFLMNTKTAFLAGIDADLRPYFAAVYDTVAGGRNQKPTISAVVAWKNGALSGPPITEEKWVSHTSDAIRYTYSSPALTAQSVENAVAAPGPVADMSHYYSGNYTPERAVSGEFSGTTMKIKLMVRRRLGLHLAATPAIPVLGPCQGDEITAHRTLPTGKIGAYQVGALVDAQLLGRSLVGGELSASLPDNYVDLPTYVNSTFSTLRGRQALPPTEGTSLSEAIDASLADDASLTAVKSNMFAAGTLPLEIDRFLVQINAAAKAYAESHS